MRVHSTIYVCQCCMLSHANGECCDGHAESNGEEFDITVHPDARFYASTDTVTVPAVWGLWGHDEFHFGMSDDTDDYSTTPCEGCGNPAHGERYEFTVFTAGE